MSKRFDLYLYTFPAADKFIKLSNVSKKELNNYITLWMKKSNMHDYFALLAGNKVPWIGTTIIPANERWIKENLL